MAKTMKRQLTDSGTSHPRGILRGPKGIAITPVGLPMADYFFQATSYRVKRLGNNLHILFGAQTAFADASEDEYRLAIEIVYPVEVATRFLYHLNWIHKSASGDESFAKILETLVTKDLATYSPPPALKVPSGPSFRSFPSNFSIMSLSTGQGSIEFFEAPPGTIVEAIYQHSGHRPNSDVRAILTVVIPPIELFRFLTEVKSLLQSIPIDLDEGGN